MPEIVQFNKCYFQSVYHLAGQNVDVSGKIAAIVGVVRLGQGRGSGRDLARPGAGGAGAGYAGPGGDAVTVADAIAGARCTWCSWTPVHIQSSRPAHDY